MTKAAKGKADKKAAAKESLFKVDDKVFAMDGGDLYEAKVSSRCSTCLPRRFADLLESLVLGLLVFIGF